MLRYLAVALLYVVFSTINAFATPAFVQQKYATPQSPQSSVTVAYASQVAGNTNIVAIGWNDTTTSITSVQDSAGNVYTPALGTFKGSGFSQAIYYAPNIKAGANSVTVRFSVAAKYVDLRITEYSGLDASAPFIVGASATGTSTTASSGAVSVPSANSLLFGAGMTISSFTGAGSGYTLRVITNPDADIVEDRVATASGSYSATAPNASGGWVMQIAAFKAAGSAPPPPDTQPPSVPANVAGTSPSSSQINLTWSASTDNVGVTGYKVFRDGAIIAPNVTGTSYVDTGLAPSTAYSYAVAAFDLAGNVSAQSSPASVTTQAQSTVGPTGPVGPQASITCSGVNVPAGANIQAAINAAGASTTFCLAAGTYAQAVVTPKSGDRIIGTVGTILDGQNAVPRAFIGGSASNVTVSNLVIQNYNGGYQVAAFDSQYTTGWAIDHLEIRYNAAEGINVGDNTSVRFSYIHHNGDSAFGNGGQGVGIVFDSNEIAFQNYQNRFSKDDQAGGGKLWATTGAMVTHNYSHDNHGTGLWSDNDNIRTTYAFNRVENNWRAGIIHEISYSASIHDNYLSGNANPAMCSTFLWCSNILISGSGGTGSEIIEIYNNTIVNNSLSHGIGMIEQSRGSGVQGPYILQNISVHNNNSNMTAGGQTGAVEDNGDTGVFTRNIHFDYNSYTLGTNTTSPFAWNNSQGGRVFWQGFGMDLHGVFN